MSRKYVDFDAARQERDNTPLVVHAFGDDWNMPPSPPAEVMLEIVRLQADSEEAKAEGRPAPPVNQAKQAQLLSSLVPNDVLRQWFENGLTMDEYGLMVELIMDKYAEKNHQKEGDQGEAPAPAGASV